MMCAMGDNRAATPSAERLLAVIELQNAIAAAGMSADEVMRIVAERATTLTSAAGAQVVLVEGDELVTRAAAGSTKGTAGGRPGKASLAGKCIAERKPIRGDEDGASALYAPLLYGEHAVGAVGVANKHAFGDEDLETLQLLAQIVAIALHRAFTYPRPKLDHHHDPLTGLANRRAFDERVQAELGRNQRYGHSFSLALVELDGIENVVDRKGQAAADEIVRAVAGILKKHTRVIDACFRLGSDEFAIVMPGTSLEGAKILAERCRAHIAEAKLSEPPLITSFGVVEAAHETAAEIAGRAAAALDGDRSVQRA
jgi:diguanylate cyclase (GGDEF)-like protein